VSFRSTEAKVSVASEEQAIAWLRTNAPSAIKTKESVLVSQIPDTIKVQMLERPADAEKIGFTVVPASQNVTIKTV